MSPTTRFRLGLVGASALVVAVGLAARFRLALGTHFALDDFPGYIAGCIVAGLAYAWFESATAKSARPR